MRADFHNHTRYSDGSATSEEVFKLAKQNGLAMLAITDHDTVEGIAEHRKNADKYGIKYINGLEVSAFDYQNNKPCHLIGLGVDPTNQALKMLIDGTLRQRQHISLKRIERLKELGYQIDFTDFSEQRLVRGVYKQHIMEVLIGRGYASQYYGKFYQENFKNGGPLDFSIDYPSHLAAIEAINGAGGISILAHPSLYNNFNGVDAMVKAGLMGIEYIYPSASRHDREMIKAMADNYHLLLSGGSDYHGRYADSSGAVTGQYYIDHLEIAVSSS